jgi:gas vesicle protein
MAMKDAKNSGMKKGVSRVWLGVAALVGAATAYLGDPQRGGARREAAVRQVSSAAKTVTERAGRWRNVVSSRLSRGSDDKLPEQVTVPTEAKAETKKGGSA